MELKLYDTLTREKRAFAPIDEKRVRMYVCGPTVYDFAHIGNARPVIVFDVLYRLLRQLYGPDHVTYVRNITDVDDKINARAAEQGISIRELTESTYANFKADVAALGCLPPDVEPRATEHIEEMKTLIEKLIASGHAYVAEDNVLFSVPSMPDYGRLSKRPLDEMIAGARVDVAPYKKHDQDFVLWKPSKPGEPAWPSPGGIAVPGRPGWHIECSAMSWKHLGETFDIHGGGIDLVFPHHENEIAQSRCAFHTGVMANVWMHNGFLQVEGEKMSKSLGNFRTISDLREDWQGEVIRYQMLMTHYRQPIDWTESTSREAQYIVDKWYEFLRDNQDSLFEGDLDQKVIDCLSDDLNTSAALGRMAVLFDEAKRDKRSANEFFSTARFLGFFAAKAETYFKFYRQAGGVWPKSSPEIVEEINSLRDQARAKKDFETADRLRDVIYLFGYRALDKAQAPSELIAADKDYFSVTPNTKAKLSKAVKLATDIAKLSTVPSPESGFVAKRGHIFNYRPDYLASLGEAFFALEHDLGAGAISEQDLDSVITDVVLSNLSTATSFGPDVVVSAILLKLLSGVIRTFDVYFENNLLNIPRDGLLDIGGVSIVSEPPSILQNVDHIAFKELFAWKDDAKSFIRVRVTSTPRMMRDRALYLARAFGSAIRLLLQMLPNRDPDTFVPPAGTPELDFLIHSGAARYIAVSEDKSMVAPGWRSRFGYKISAQTLYSIQNSELKRLFDEVFFLKLFEAPNDIVSALNSLSRARATDEATESVRWNLEAVETMCRSFDENLNASQVLSQEFSELGVERKDSKRLLQQLEKLRYSRRHAVFASLRDITLAQSFAEQAVTLLLLRKLSQLRFK